MLLDYENGLGPLVLSTIHKQVYHSKMIQYSGMHINPFLPNDFT